MAGPLTVAQILKKRRQAQQALHQEALSVVNHRSAALSDPEGHTTVINLPLPPAVFTVVSWNVQTFEAGKSLGNPFVNKVINRVLEAVSADVCILLESRSDSYVNMNAIETGHVGVKGWKQAADEEEQDDDDEGDEEDDDGGVVAVDEDDDDAIDEDDDGAPLDLLDGGEPLTYQQNVSEMTGKRWLPPKALCIYEPAMVKLQRDVRDLSRIATLKKKKKLTKKETAALKRLRKKRDKNLEADDGYYDVAKRARKHAGQKKFLGNYGYFPKLTKALCVTEQGAPTQTWLEHLRDESFTLVRDYYQLVYVKDDWSEQVLDWSVDISSCPAKDNWRFMLRLKKCTCGESLGSGSCGFCEELGAYTTSLQNLRQAVDSLTFYMCTCQESYSILLRQETDVMNSSTAGVWVKDKLVSVKSAAARLVMRAPDELDTSHGKPVLKAGTLLGYQDNSIGFYGRCPYLLPVELWLPYRGTSQMMYLVAFHGPFGASTNAGVELRAAAMRELMSAGTEPSKALDDEENVMVIGDFNLDWAPDAPKPNGHQKIANALYKDFNKRGFSALIPDGIATSLASIHGAAKWKQKGPDTASFTSSAYDNCFLKGSELKSHVASAAVLDVISWIEENLSEFKLPDDDPQKGKLGTLSKKHQAFYIYRKYVSDHLPIVCDFLVAPISPHTKALRARARALENPNVHRAGVERTVALLRSVTRPSMEAVFHFDEMLDFDVTTTTVDQYLPVYDGETRVATCVGQVDRHQDGYLILKCEPFQGQILWTSWRPMARPRGLDLFLRIHPPGTRVQWKMRNPRPAT
ncbi:hypothetical protein [Corallococcus macrosporus]|uniref:Endonuclease/exonuclease/phosphatase domain-containing protein n=1 Tax=Corallococcus macrosporus DSM 14697 TaxID=1189310 RepID=A0A250JT68_9BACT|nr:hypothetical protein [Corallococcus macrosporus]ATB46561.1 hypothetical protein MYMAC_002166 [Corallococcus macrosporus DSM 14697]